jgi:hypothetical protein
LRDYGLTQSLAAMWSNFQAGDWRFPEIPPRAILRRIDIDEEWLDDAEFRRALWFWQQRPALLLGEHWPLYALVMLVAVALLWIPVWGVALASLWIVLAFVGIVIDIVRLSRWRRNYESSIARMLRISQN